jgi:hypothetical protein
MPYVHVHINLNDFDVDDLIEELKDRGYVVTEQVTGLSHLNLEEQASVMDFNHIEHLAICGQLDAARSEALELVGQAIGRRLQ